uniref:Uncharacterized protein n=1 Tax=Timema bartmani TaxID=61472 RepID=A0A7R9HZI4_9NEOP|nr:unnamed protein product [Timema bartmani]
MCGETWQARNDSSSIKRGMIIQNNSSDVKDLPEISTVTLELQHSTVLSKQFLIKYHQAILTLLLINRLSITLRHPVATGLFRPAPTVALHRPSYYKQADISVANLLEAIHNWDEEETIYRIYTHIDMEDEYDIGVCELGTYRTNTVHIFSSLHVVLQLSRAIDQCLQGCLCDPCGLGWADETITPMQWPRMAWTLGVMVYSLTSNGVSIPVGFFGLGPHKVVQ